jgi:hypothetical protein
MLPSAVEVIWAICSEGRSKRAATSSEREKSRRNMRSVRKRGRVVVVSAGSMNAEA